MRQRCSFKYKVIGIIAKVLVAIMMLKAAFGVGEAFAKDIEIAVIGPMSGDFRDFGAEMKGGAQLAVDDINAGGGLAGDKLKLVVMDDGGDPEKAEEAAKALVRRRVRFVVGHYNSGASIYASRIYAKNNTLMVSPASTNPMLTDAGLWNTIRTSGRDDVQGIVAGEYLAKHFAGKNIAIVGDGSPYAEGLAIKAQTTLKAAGNHSVWCTNIKYGQTDFSKLVDKLKARKIDAVFFTGLAAEYAHILRRAKEAGLTVQFIAGDGTWSQKMLDIAGAATEGTFVVFSLDDARNPAAQAVVPRLHARGIQTMAYTLKAYAAVQVIAKGIEISGTQAPRAVAKAIKTGSAMPTVLGDLSFDSKGDRRQRDATLYVWKGGTAVPPAD